MRIAAPSLVAALLLAPPWLLASDRQKAAERFLVARELADEGRIDAALSALDDAARLTPGDPYLMLERALLLARAGRSAEASAAIAAAVELAPGEAEILRQQGRIEMGRLGEDERAPDIARRAFEALRRLDSDDLEALVALGQLYLAGGRPALAAEVLEEADRQRPDHPWIQSLRARALEATGERSEVGQQDLERLRRDPGDLRLRFELAARLARAGENRRAADLLAAAPDDQLAEPELRYRLTRQLFLAGEIEPARELAAKLVAANPQVAPARFLLARAEIALGYFAAAEATLGALADQAVGDPLVTELLLRSFEGQGKLDEAAALLTARRQELLRLGDLESAEASALELARLWVSRGRWEEASAAAQPVLKSAEPLRANAAARMVARTLALQGDVDGGLAIAASLDPQTSDRLRLELLLLTGRTEEALALADRLASDSRLADLTIAGLLQDSGEFGAALPRLVEARRTDPGSLEAVFRLASCLERLGRREESVSAFRELLAREPDFAPALNYLGYLWIERAENLEQAVGMVDRAVRLDPDNGAYVDSLGWGFFQLGRVPDAVRMLERAARLLPHDPTVLEHLGDALAAAGDAAGAREAYGRALAAGATSADALDDKRRRLGGDS